ncbi:MAG TPA: zf-HC2 domain-containing protein, partial [Thermoanaerobaculia bacterium]|nr:zf-HC2 domain-containing protein [Thermoanaerobaculia bacterium]
MPDRGTANCPSVETLAAFADGRLEPRQRAEVVAHLDGCDECMTQVALAMDVREPEKAAVRTRPRIMAAAAAIIVLVAGAWIWTAVARKRTSSIAQLVALTPRSERLAEPRLSGGFAWAAYRGAARTTSDINDPERMKLAGAAGEIIQRAQRDRSADAQQAAGIAMVLVQQPLAATPYLEAAARAGNEAKAWSDLAAARYAAAAELQRASLYPEALAAADRALRIDTRLPEALFNRALIVERMRLLAEARQAWMKYLEVDASSEWAREARAHLDALPESTSLHRFERDRPRLEQIAAAGDVARIRLLAGLHRAHARAYAETEYLGRWGDAYLRGDAREATR